jgi:hypothetical protein
MEMNGQFKALAAFSPGKELSFLLERRLEYASLHGQSGRDGDETNPCHCRE